MSLRVPLRRPLVTASVLFGLALTPLLSTAAAVELAGVKLEDRATVAGTPLVLNGAGIRYKAVMKSPAAKLAL